MSVDSLLFGAVLFTPGDAPARFDKAWMQSRGALILDLEDAVALDRKPTARCAVGEWIAAGGAPLVRVNAPGSPLFAEDVAALRRFELRGIVVPKTSGPDDLDAVRRIWPRAALYPLIESPEGLVQAVAIARGENVAQLCLGMLDLSAACGIAYPHDAFQTYARIELALASKIARLAGPVDTPHPAYRDLALVVDEAAAAARLGFSAKLCIHPAQIEPVNAAFAPSAADMQWAEEIVAAGRSGGAHAFKGTMIDPPVVARAEAIIERAARIKAG